MEQKDKIIATLRQRYVHLSISHVVLSNSMGFRLPNADFGSKVGYFPVLMKDIIFSDNSHQTVGDDASEYLATISNM